ncbi:hypothetical protein OIE62_22385 [Streptomyces scopuliridis]|uniref:Uncharacterized protein n=1 Tax=Streptomyces scopuliridis TaxID=452529 RepID=A0ACD4ZNY5_9ACTN|nr:hypothetical protein [Streptomyces scopuliridis]WSB34576.1 hypothetical protein OG949_18010 [Streptomyces scopuliridis]WSB98821.1 hypothetical protein OG835_18560 [Streptomyces scopuliridis]WSC07475.1 hypothetical protein OIE62_22385 [Streptomyces scopuliridis]
MSAARRGKRRATLPPRAWSVLAASVGLIALSGAAVSATVLNAGGSEGVVTHRETATPEEVLEFWTPERIKQAKPAEMPVQPVECVGRQWFVHPHCW